MYLLSFCVAIVFLSIVFPFVRFDCWLCVYCVWFVFDGVVLSRWAFTIWYLFSIVRDALLLILISFD